MKVKKQRPPAARQMRSNRSREYPEAAALAHQEFVVMFLSILARCYSSRETEEIGSFSAEKITIRKIFRELLG
jgi:hypothetical protein